MQIVPCDTDVAINITIGGVDFSISNKTYIIGPVYSPIDDTYEGCIGGFVARADCEQPFLIILTKSLRPLAASFWIFGSIFLQNVYTEFDAKKRRIGFAPLA